MKKNNWVASIYRVGMKDNWRNVYFLQYTSWFMPSRSKRYRRDKWFKDTSPGAGLTKRILLEIEKINMKKLLLLFLFAAKVCSSQTIENYLSAPFPSNLIASADGKTIAWVFNDKGSRNVYVADGTTHECKSNNELPRRRWNRY